MNSAAWSDSIVSSKKSIVLCLNLSFSPIRVKEDKPQGNKMRTFKLGWLHVLAYSPGFNWNVWVSWGNSEICQYVLVCLCKIHTLPQSKYLSVSQHSSGHTWHTATEIIPLLQNPLDRKKWLKCGQQFISFFSVCRPFTSIPLLHTLGNTGCLPILYISIASCFNSSFQLLLLFFSQKNVSESAKW